MDMRLTALIITVVNGFVMADGIRIARFDFGTEPKERGAVLIRMILYALPEIA
jgi:hypothetical protein